MLHKIGHILYKVCCSLYPNKEFYTTLLRMKVVCSISLRFHDVP